MFPLYNIQTRNLGNMEWDLILRMWDNMEKIKLNTAKFINMRPLNRDSRFNVIAQGVVLSLFDWLVG